jgi:transcriptional regulator GlxA family with amidase domain
MVEKDAGNELARSVSRDLVMYHQRGGGQTQHSALLELEPKSDRIQSALDYARRNLHTPLTVDQLAEAARLSPRQFSRAFHEETGLSPAKAIENLRIETAKVMIEDGRHSIDVIAREAGFGSRDRVRWRLWPSVCAEADRQLSARLCQSLMPGFAEGCLGSG